MKKIKYIGIIFALLICSNVKAAIGFSRCNYGEKNSDYRSTNVNEIIPVTNFRETTNLNDEYDTIEKNSTIIATTKFTPDQIITAKKAAQAGFDYGVLKVSSDNYIYNNNGMEAKIYMYYGEIGGWYSVDANNDVTYINDSELLEKLSTQDIYAINNIKKGIFIARMPVSEGCINNGIYTINYDSSSGLADYYVSSFANEIELDLDDVYLLKRSYSSTDGTHLYDDGTYNIIKYEIEIVNVEDSVTGQAMVYVKNSDGTYLNHAVYIKYLNGEIEEINIPSTGYLLPNINAITEIKLKK